MGFTDVTFGPTPLSRLYFADLMFYQAGKKRLFKIKKFGTVLLYSCLLPGKTSQNILLRNQNAVMYSCY